MIRICFFLLCLFAWLPSVSAAATDEAAGTIVDADTGLPVAGAVVRAVSRTGRTTAFTSSDSDGCFKLTLPTSTDSLSFSCLGYRPQKTAAGIGRTAVVQLTPQATQLRDIVVKAPDIYARGDTLVFNVEKYAQAKDDAIIDVIKRLPGIKVEDDGTILYQGKPINKFYIDGNDFIGGSYGMATENISHGDVKSVEVMENHQPVKALEGIEFPEEAGINLKLKEDARTRPVGVVQATSGITALLGSASLYSMRIGPRVQSVVNAMADNTGRNPASQVAEHDFVSMFGNGYTETLWPDDITADMISTPLNEKRTRNSRSWTAGAVTTWKRGDTSMRLKLNYTGEIQDHNSGAVTDYFSADVPALVQDNSLRTRRHDVSAAFNAEVNKRNYYMKDRLTIAAADISSTSAVTGSYDRTQQVERQSIQAVNDLKTVRRTDKKVFELASRNSFLRRPERMLVGGERNATQNIDVTDIRSTTETEVGRMWRFLKFHLTANADINYHHMNTALAGAGVFDNSKRYDAMLSVLSAGPRMIYERGNNRLSLSVPLKWLHNSLSERHNYINMSPSASIRRQLTSKSSMSVSAMYSLGSPAARLDITAPVMTDWHNLTVASNTGRYSNSLTASMSYRYRNPLTATFANVSASYGYNHNATITNRLFTDNYIITTFADIYTDSHTATVTGGASKGFGHGKIVAGCELTASYTSAASMSDNAVVPYKQSYINFRPYFKGSIMRILSVNYEASCSYSAMSLSSGTSGVTSMTQNLSVTMTPHDRVILTAGAEQFVNIFGSSDTSNLILLDVTASWHINSKLRLTLTANNLSDKRRYEYASYGTLSRTTYSYYLRGREITATLQVRF